MKNIRLALGSLALLAVGCSSQIDLEAERTALRETDQAWVQSPPDVEAFVSHLADDVNVLPFDSPLAAGKEAARVFFSKSIRTPGFTLKSVVDQVEVSRAGDLGYTRGHFEITVDGPGGAPATVVGKYVTIWKKQANGKWKVVTDIFNRDTPAGN